MKRTKKPKGKERTVKVLLVNARHKTQVRVRIEASKFNPRGVPAEDVARARKCLCNCSPKENSDRPLTARCGVAGERGGRYTVIEVNPGVYEVTEAAAEAEAA